MYELITFIAVAFSLFLIPPGNKKLGNLYSFVYYLLWALLFATIAFRSEEIGVDTINYINKYFTIIETPSYLSYGGIGSTEPLYFYLNKVLGYLCGDWSQSVMVVEAILITICYGTVFRKYSTNPLLSTLGFLAFGLYLASLCLLRQFMAMAVCVWSLKYVFERKPTKFYICVLIASMLHYTAIFWVITYYVCAVMTKGKKKDYLFVIIAVIGYFFVGFFQETTSNITERWNGYSALESGAEGFVSFSMFLMITVFAFIYRFSITANYRYGRELIYLNYINMIFWTMRLVTRNAERLSFYFAIAPIILVPILCDVVQKKYGKVTGDFFKFIVIALMTVLFVYKFKYKSGESLYPFRFISFS